MNHSPGTKDSFVSSCIRSMRQDSTGIPTLFSDGKEFHTTRDKASVLNYHFQSVFTSEDLSNIPSYHRSISSMPPIIISVEGIEALLTN